MWILGFINTLWKNESGTGQGYLCPTTSRYLGWRPVTMVFTYLKHQPRLREINYGYGRSTTVTGRQPRLQRSIGYNTIYNMTITTGIWKSMGRQQRLRWVTRALVTDIWWPWLRDVGHGPPWRLLSYVEERLKVSVITIPFGFHECIIIYVLTAPCSTDYSFKGLSKYTRRENWCTRPWRKLNKFLTDYANDGRETFHGLPNQYFASPLVILISRWSVKGGVRKFSSRVIEIHLDERNSNNYIGNNRVFI